MLFYFQGFCIHVGLHVPVGFIVPPFMILEFPLCTAFVISVLQVPFFRCVAFVKNVVYHYDPAQVQVL